MMWSSHLTIGIAAGALTAFAINEPANPVVYTAAIVGSLWPDIDEPRSKVGRILPFISYPLSKIFTHRVQTHSILINLCLFLLLFFLPYPSILSAQLYQIILFGFFAGIFSHIFSDMITYGGVSALYPVTRKRYSFGGGLFQTGSWIEKPVALTILISSVVFVINATN